MQFKGLDLSKLIFFLTTVVSCVSCGTEKPQGPCAGPVDHFLSYNTNGLVELYIPEYDLKVESHTVESALELGRKEIKRRIKKGQ